MKKAILSFIVLFLSAISLNAQEVAFKALASAGDNVVERATNPGNYEPIKLGTPIYKNDKIIVGANGYIGLTSNAGKTIQISEEGIYPVDNLSGELKPDQSDIAQKYIAYIFDNMSKSGSEDNMSLTGSVERSLDNQGINLFLPPSTKVMPDKKTSVSWVAQDDASSYRLVISNLFDEEVYSTSTNETSVELDFSSLELDPNDVYKMAVYNQDNEKIQSGVATLEILSGEAADKIMTDFAAVEAAAGGDDAISYLVKASFYEQNGMYMEAVEYFEKAIAAQPEVEQYKILYQNFKKKTGIEGEL